EKQEFRGFARAEAREEGDASVAAKRARFVFDTGRQEPCLKGKQLSEEVLGDDGKLFEHSVTTWRTRVLAEGVDGRRVCYAYGEAEDRFVHEGEAVGIRLRSETDYDDYGNAVAERRLGVLDTAGDEVLVDRELELRLEDWRLDLVVRETTRDGAGNRVRELLHAYDARGNRERTEAWLDTEDRRIPTLRQRFDSFGNVIETTDARGNRRTVQFDSLLHAHPVAETIHLGTSDLVMTADYDLGLGVVTAAVDFSAQRRDYAYDPLGRLIDVRDPGGAGESYEYQLGSPVSRVVKRVREDLMGGTFDSYTYSDGRGRPLGAKVEGEGGRWRFLDAKAYNARKLAARSWLAHWSDTPEYTRPEETDPHDATAYDALGRPTETLEADGSRSRTEYRPLARLSYDGNDLAGLGGPDVRRSDGLERLVSVEERNGAETYRTTYAWNARGELERIVDALGNTRRFRFDSLGRLIEVHDPDRGLRRYAYDDAGDMVRRTDAKGRVTTYAHDAAHRILEKDHVGSPQGGPDSAESTYHYDVAAGSLDSGDGTAGTARNTLGRLAWVEDTTGEEHFSYDERGNVEWVLKRLRHPETDLVVPYRTQRTYDLMNREAEVVFPDNDRIVRQHGPGSFVERLSGGPAGGLILEAADYAPSGQPLRLSLGNGCESSFAHDASQRLTRLVTLDSAGTAIVHQALAYDRAFNVAAIDDGRPAAEVPLDSPRRATARFDYDELHRLTLVRYGAEGEGGRIDYAYDAIGNLLEQTTPGAGLPGHIEDPAVNLGAVSYAGGRTARGGRGPSDPPGPHALTGTASGRSLRYDADGNVKALDDAELAWDPEDRLAAYKRPGIDARYLHDHAERRVAKLVARGRVRSETLYVDGAFEVADGSPAKYALLDGKRLARIQGRLDPARDAVQRLPLAAGWNLVAAAVQSALSLREALGPDASIYEARGATYAAVSTTGPVPSGKALWVHVPSPRLAVLRGPPLGAAPLDPSPGPLHAWPFLAPLRPSDHIPGAPRVHVFDPASRSWLLRDPSLPGFLSDAAEELAPAQAFWSAGAIAFAPAAAEPPSIVYYHQDSVGSTAALTDGDGRLIEERAHYPFGVLRAVHRPLGASGGTDYDFTGKERDGESGLTALGARSYLDAAGTFLSPDPRLVDIAKLAAGSESDKASFAAFIENPQMGNLYAYGLRNPLKYVDPDGLEVIISKDLQNDPAFKKAYKLFIGTQEGKKIFNLLERSDYKVFIRRGDLSSRPVNKPGAFVGGITKPANEYQEINIIVDVDAHTAKLRNKDFMIKSLADSIDHELIHADIFAAVDWFKRSADQHRARNDPASEAAAHSASKAFLGLHELLDTGIHPANQSFQKEIGLPQPKPEKSP
ncbi:MAG: RHS repeat-associated core domain-containing protein, partial [Planctomycetes bacterium]|nr:RHS repeat-associated core domain-containing protein [Planctomycetota bacterium]